MSYINIISSGSNNNVLSRQAVLVLVLVLEENAGAQEGDLFSIFEGTAC